MKIEKSQDGSGYVLTSQSGASMKIPFDEFWEICRTGNRIDTKGEVEEYLMQCDEINGHDLDRIRAFPSLVDRITEQVIQDRIENENGDQIYDAAEKCMREHIAEIETQVKWFRLSENHCISVWYAPDSHDGDQFQMHLELVDEDGLMGSQCEILSDESYATNNISFESLCETLNEICSDAGITDGAFNGVEDLAAEIFESFNMDIPALKEAGNMSRIDDIKQFKANAATIEDLKRQQLEDEATALADQIRALKPRIDELLETANACRDAGIPMTGKAWGGHEGYDTHQFMTNSWSHLVGFVGVGDSYPLSELGINGGGACGKWNFRTDGVNVYESSGTEVRGPQIAHMKHFLEKFDEFESAFYTYVDKVIEKQRASLDNVIQSAEAKKQSPPHNQGHDRADDRNDI